MYVIALFHFYRSGQSKSFASEDVPQVWYRIISFEVGVKIIHAFGNINQQSITSMFNSILDCHFKFHPFITQQKEH